MFRCLLVASTLQLLFLLVAGATASIHVVYETQIGKTAAKEIRRYVYAARGVLATVHGPDPASPWQPSLCKVADDEIIYLASPHSAVSNATGLSTKLDDANDAERLVIRSYGAGDVALQKLACPNVSNVVVCAGNRPRSPLQCAYRLAERLGVRFSLHGDTVPDRRPAPASTGNHLFADVNVVVDPLFSVRGLQPFHDFPDGVDWWTLDDFKAILTQMEKMTLNFIGFHTYCKTADYCEPTVWVGPKEDVNDDGTVKTGYKSAYASTLRGNYWGYTAGNTSDFKFGGHLMFESECYGSQVQAGACPQPMTDEENLMVLNRAGAFWGEVVAYARALGIKTAVGNQAPLSDWYAVNTTGRAVEFYEGIFTRVQKAYPVDYYWLWMPEEWLSGSAQVSEVTNDIMAMESAYSSVKPSFQLATCGWTPGPKNNRTYIDSILPANWAYVSSLDASVGMEPPDPAFKDIKHSKWIIPWLEDDPGLTAPQLWVNRTLEHVNLALQYKADGVLGIHWRTREIGPQLDAMTASLLTPGYTSDKFWHDWAASEFGPEISQTAAAIFKSIESFRLPRPVNWNSKSERVQGGPGSLSPDTSFCDWSSKYAFLDELQALRESVQGPANTNRLMYWLHSFRYMRAIAMSECNWGLLSEAVSAAMNETDTEKRRQIAENVCLPLRISLIQNVTDMMAHLLQMVSSAGEMGTFANLMLHSGPGLLNASGEVVENLLGRPLPSEAMPTSDYVAPPRVFVPTVRTTVGEDEQLTIKIIAMSSQPPHSVVLYLAPIGSKEFSPFPASLVTQGRGVYRVVLPRQLHDFEYYVEADFGKQQIVFPATAPSQCQTVVIH